MLVAIISGLAIIVAVVAAYFSFLQARAAAKPRIVITVLDELVFAPGEEATLRIELRNRPFFHATPVATDVRAYLNVDHRVQPLRLRFGAALSNLDDQIKTGKQNSRYLKAVGIVLLPRQSEIVEFDIRLPRASGRYRFCIDVLSAEGANASLETSLNVREAATVPRTAGVEPMLDD